MDYTEKESLIYHIIVGKYAFNKYYLVSNTKEDILQAYKIYTNFIKDNVYSEYLSKENLAYQLDRLGIWTFQNDNELKTLETNLDNMKVSLYENSWNSDLVVKMKKRISQVKKGILKSYHNKNTFFQETLEYHASLLRHKYLIAMGIRNKHNKRIFNYNNFFNKSSYLIDKFLFIVDNDIITVEQYREIARTEPFRSMWNASKHRVFQRHISELTDHQKTLMSFARMYDGVYKHHESPPEHIINDDDMLDGWLIKQSRTRKEKQKESVFQDKFPVKGKNKNGKQELFVMASNQEEAQSIYNLNDDQSRNIIRSRNQSISSNGNVDVTELPDVRLDLQMQATQEFKQSMRNL